MSNSRSVERGSFQMLILTDAPGRETIPYRSDPKFMKLRPTRPATGPSPRRQCVNCQTSYIIPTERFHSRACTLKVSRIAFTRQTPYLLDSFEFPCTSIVQFSRWAARHFHPCPPPLYSLNRLLPCCTNIPHAYPRYLHRLVERCLPTQSMNPSDSVVNIVCNLRIKMC